MPDEVDDVPKPFRRHQLSNGLTLLGERMSGVRSAAMALLVPAGSSTDPVDRCGSANVIVDNLFRGAGDRGNRELTNHLDRLGLQRGSGVGVHHARFSVSCVGERMLDAIPVYGDILRRPHLPEDGFQASRDLALQALDGLEDDPRGKLSVKLREWHWPSPYSRNAMGQRSHLEKLTNELCKVDYAQRYRPERAILSVAGDIDFDKIVEAVEAAFGDWEPGEEGPIELMPPPGRYHHEEAKTEQTHIGLAYPSVPETHPDYYYARLSNEVLSGSMSSRLFTEVREKRALCYSVGAGYSSLPEIGSILGYAGSSNERAQATLDQFVIEVRRMAEGVTGAELERSKIGLKSATVMSGESTGARAGALAHDWFIRKRLRTIEEILAAIDAVTVDQVNDYLKANPAGPFTVVTVGPAELTIPE